MSTPATSSIAAATAGMLKLGEPQLRQLVAGALLETGGTPDRMTRPLPPRPHVRMPREPKARYASSNRPLNTGRTADGLPPLPVAARAALGDPADGMPTLSRGRRGRWDRPSLVAGLALAIQKNPSRQLRQRDLHILAIDDARIPHASVLGTWMRRHPGNTWEDLRGEAEAAAKVPAENMPRE